MSLFIGPFSLIVLNAMLATIKHNEYFRASKLSEGSIGRVSLHMR